MVMDLLCELNLACRKTGTALLVPSLLPPTAGVSVAPWHPRSNANQAYGRRLQCWEDITLFSPGLFPRVQVICWNDASLGPDTRLWFNGLSSQPDASTTVVASMGSDRRSVDVCAWSTDADVFHALAACRTAVDKVVAAINKTIPVCCNGMTTTTLALSTSQLLDPSLCNTTQSVFGHDLDGLTDLAPSTPIDTVPALANPHSTTTDSIGDLLGIPVLKLLVIRSNSQLGGAAFLEADKEESLIRRAFGIDLPKGHACQAVQVMALGHVTVAELEQVLLDFEPDWLHFIGHGQPEGLELVHDNGSSVVLSSNALAEMLAPLNLRGLVLNCCYSSHLVPVVRHCVPTVIAGAPEMLDESGLVFAQQFWGHVFQGQTLEQSFAAAKREAEHQDYRGPDEFYHFDLFSNDLRQEKQPVSAAWPWRPAMGQWGNTRGGCCSSSRKGARARLCCENHAIDDDRSSIASSESGGEKARDIPILHEHEDEDGWCSFKG
eukprot:m.216140 g.216140  ORF g.216140 m.216140 type:complete len:491 (-) comp18651_c0_seq1:90-1562(-)